MHIVQLSKIIVEKIGEKYFLFLFYTQKWFSIK